MLLVYRFLLLLFIIISKPLAAQDCEKAWMYYEQRLELSQITERHFGISVPVEKIQIDFLGAPVGIPFNYTIQKYSTDNDHIILENEKGFYLHKEAYQALEAMRVESEKEGIYLQLNNTYRSYSYQKHLHNKLGAKQAERPGYSEHHLFTAIDLERVTNKKFLWLLRHAFDFGWVPSYYFREGSAIKKEPWHWRYVGKLAATKFRCAWKEEIDRRIWKLKKK